MSKAFDLSNPSILATSQNKSELVGIHIPCEETNKNSAALSTPVISNLFILSNYLSTF